MKKERRINHILLALGEIFFGRRPRSEEEKGRGLRQKKKEEKKKKKKKEEEKKKRSGFVNANYYFWQDSLLA